MGRPNGQEMDTCWLESSGDLFFGIGVFQNWHVHINSLVY